MRQVVKPDMVAHLWANKSQVFARTARRTLFFEGDVIYSYGNHFSIARHVHTKRGEAVLFTTKGYGSITAGHKRIVAGACRHLTVFCVPEVRETRPVRMLESYSVRIFESLAKYVKARTMKPCHEYIMRELVEEGNALAVLFGLKGRLTMPDLANAKKDYRKMTEREAERSRRAEVKARKEAEERQKQWDIENQEYLKRVGKSLTKWVRGGRREYSFCQLPCRLRIVGENIETSHGAEFPLAHGVKAFKLIRLLHDGGRSWERNGREIRLGPFHVDVIDAEGNVVAGCHKVEWKEIRRIAKLAGVE